MSNKINWFIGHMKRTVDVLSEKKKNVDFVIEVLDSRLPIGSSNNELISIFNNKPIIKIALKSDLINKNDFKNDLFYASIFNKNDRKRIINHIDFVLKSKKDSLIKKGLKSPTFIGMVVGLPNIGKSSLINFLSNRRRVNVENRPGVTRKSENIKITESLFLIDTPGVFIKNVDNYNLGLSLSLINCVNRNVVDKRELILFLINLIISKKRFDILNRNFNYDLKKNNSVEILEDLIRLFKINKDNYEIDEFYIFILKKIIDNNNEKLCLE